MKASRRRLLKALGLGGAALGLPGLRWTEDARAQTGSPSRLVIFTTAHGPPREHWKFDHPMLPTDRDSALDMRTLTDPMEMSRVFRPLFDVRDKLSILDGICMMSTLLEQGGNNHGVSSQHLLTNAYGNWEPYVDDMGRDRERIIGTDAMSIDQYIAGHVTEPGQFASLEYGNTSRTFVRGEGGAVPPVETRSRSAFDRLFPDGGMTGEPREPTRRELIAARRGSVLDQAAEEYAILAPSLSDADRRKLDQHQTMIRDLEVRLRGRGVPAACDPTLYQESGDWVDEFSSLAAAAFSCDMTRVVTMGARELPTTEFGAPATASVHQDYAHQADADHPAELGYMADYYEHHMNQFRTIVQNLDAVPDGEGTLLDSTMVIWVSELATGTHDLVDCAAVVAGGGNGTLNPGRYIRYALNRPSGGSHYGCQRGADVGPSMSHVFVSALHAMGIEEDSFGIEMGDALDGSTIDLTGPLEEL